MAFLDPEHTLRQFGLYGALDVADIGAGAGHFSIAAARRLEGGRLFAVEIEKEMLRRLVSDAKDRGIYNIHPVWADAAAHSGVPLADGSLDRAIVTNVLHAAHDRDALAKEVRRVLKPGGKVLVIDWHEESAPGPHVRHRVPFRVAESLFSRHGFVKEKDVDAGEHHYGMIFTAPL